MKEKRERKRRGEKGGGGGGNNIINGFLQSTEATKHKQGTGSFLHLGVYGGVIREKKKSTPHQ